MLETEISTWKKVWFLLDIRERRIAFVVLAFVVSSAIASAIVIGSIVPFLSVLTNSNKIEEVRALSWVYNYFSFSSHYQFTVALGAISAGLITVGGLVQICKTYLLARFAMMRGHSISHKLFKYHLLQPYEFFLEGHTGNMAKDILDESQQAVHQYILPATEMISSVLTVLAIMVMVLWVNPIVATASFGLIGGIYGVTYFFSRNYIKKIGKDRVVASAARFKIANEALGGIKNVKISGRENTYIKRFEIVSIAMARSQVAIKIISQSPRYILETAVLSGIIILCLTLIEPEEIASGRFLEDVLPLIAVFAFAGQKLMPELQRVYSALTQLRYGAAAIDSVYRGYKLRENILNIEQANNNICLKRELRFQNVSYQYRGGKRPSVENITLSIRAGEKIGIVGTTGAGKTTLADILMGLLFPKAGEILVDGNSIKQTDIRRWQNSISYIPQEIFLADVSIAENIAFGVPPERIDNNRIKDCACLAKIASFIETELGEGYETIVGERGVRLSGGQRQRIGIARALYTDANLIVMDEATSALDNSTEREVLKAIETLPGEKTIIMIAHRLSTIQICDKIIVLDQGRVSGYGSWEELSATNTAFQEFSALTNLSDRR